MKEFLVIDIQDNQEESLHVFRVPGDTTEDQLNLISEALEELSEDWGLNNEDDYSGFCYKDAVREACDRAGIEYTPIETDVTLYI
jgi:hypothetical protein